MKHLLKYCLLNTITALAVLSSTKIIAQDKQFTLKNDNLEFILSDKLGGKFLSKDKSELSVSEKVVRVIIDNKELSFQKAVLKKMKLFGNEFLILDAKDEDRLIGLSVKIISDGKYPGTLTFESKLKNISAGEISVSEISLFNFLLDAKNFDEDSSFKFWTFQGGSYESRRDWIFPLNKNFYSENSMGMNAADYGGGMPVVDFWTKEAGIAFASISDKPEWISFPVKVFENGKVSFSINDTTKKILKPDEEITLVPVSVIFHNGDYFNALKIYSDIIKGKWFSTPSSEQQALEPEWCAWGYERNFSIEQIKRTLPMAQELDFKWATIDDGWQNADGDWNLDKNKFPGGEKEFKELVDLIHSYKMKARLWWVPLSASDSSYNVIHFPDKMNERTMKMQSKVALEHPDWFILDKDGNRVQISWWNSFYLCPAVKEVRDYYKDFTKKVFDDWDFDGFKIDGQNFNAVPPCYNPAHHHKSPYESTYAVPEYFKDIFTTARDIKNDAVIQLCPCGTNFSVYNIPYTNQFVGSDPTSPWQVRLRAKTYKALVGNNISYSGDHVELTCRKWSDKENKFVVIGPEDFASTVGLGGVISTKFTYPDIMQVDSSFMLTPEKKETWKSWMKIYNNERLSEGEYLNLYDIAFDKPETHLIKKENTYYYSFFSNEEYNGRVELRGLKNGNYEVSDFVNNKNLGEVNSNNPFLKINFKDYLLLRLKKI